MNRRSALFLFVIIAYPLYSQQGITSYQSFVIDNKEVFWTQVYHHQEETEVVSKRLFEHLKLKPWITNISRDSDDIVADLINYRPDYKRYGGKFMNTSTIIRTGKWAGKMRINFKEGKYRVILYGLSYEATQAATGSGKVTIEQHDIHGTLSEWALENYRHAFKKNRLKNLDMLHFSFKDSFTLNFNQVIDSDW